MICTEYGAVRAEAHRLLSRLDRETCVGLSANPLPRTGELSCVDKGGYFSNAGTRNPVLVDRVGLVLVAE